MDIEIKNFLEGHDTPEMIQMYEKAWDILYTLGNTNFTSSIEEITMMMSGNQFESYSSHFKHILNIHLDLALNEHSIYLVEDCPFSMKIKVLEFILQIEVTEFVSGCARLLESDETNYKELFCEVMSLVMGEEVEVYLPYIENIPRVVITNMRDYILSREELETSLEAIDNADKREQYKRIESYCRIMKAQDTIGYQLAFNYNSELNIDFYTLLSINIDKMDRSNIPTFAKELVALALCSTGWNNPQVEIEREMHRHTDDLKEISLIQRYVNDELQNWINITKKTV